MKALTAALSGDRRGMPTWNGSIETLRPWLRQLSYWELDNHVPRQRWGIKLLQSFAEGSAPRKMAEALDMPSILSEHGYGTILSEILNKYGPYLEAIGPAAVDNLFFGAERSRHETFSNYIAAKELALQEVEAQLGEKRPPRIAGRILLRGANLSEPQRENLAIKYDALLTFDQIATALRPLDRPEALMGKVNKAYMTSLGDVPQSAHDHAEEVEDGEPGDDLCEDELLEDDEPESDGEGKSKDAKGRDQSNRKPRGTPDELMAKTRCFKCNELGHMSRDCPKRESQSFFVAQGMHGSVNRTYMTVNSKAVSETVEKVSDKGSSVVGHQVVGHRVCSYVNISNSLESSISVYAGVRTESHEAVADTAAEEAVIGSGSFERLQKALAHFGLQAVPAAGATVSCSGIGGSARIHGVWDVPLGVAKTNGLLHVTVIEDQNSFETPFLLPISYQELVGATIDLDKGIFKLRNGKKTSMKRTPTGHRTISILEFGGPWPDRAFLAINDLPTSLEFRNPRFKMRARITSWISKEDQETDQSYEKKPSQMSSQKRCDAWKRMTLIILNMIIHANQEHVVHYLTNRNAELMLQDQERLAQRVSAKVKGKNQNKVRRGIGRPLTRSTAWKTWRFEPSKCPHEEDQLRQRAGGGHHWWTCLACGARWERLESAADVMENAKLNQPKGSASPQILPAPRYRPDLSHLELVEQQVTPPGTSIVRTIKAEMMKGKSKGKTGPPKTEETETKLVKVKSELTNSRRRSASAGVRATQERARQRTPSFNGEMTATEAFEIHSSEGESWSPVTTQQNQPMSPAT
ncbi:unnamed protein product [Cladocopium goreaui]|uniref:Gypsy retrotransposon integrase-like protein 1 n=1 Tax=Cladocopium goreaui TaxID=2562237 RepID=A0A9P1DGH4_9DINO|nr:unnamed protein product [Cladocopium goreaui]